MTDCSSTEESGTSVVWVRVLLGRSMAVVATVSLPWMSVATVRAVTPDARPVSWRLVIETVVGVAEFLKTQKQAPHLILRACRT